MKKPIVLALIIAFLPATVFAAANCAHSHSWQCTHQGATTTNQGGKDTKPPVTSLPPTGTTTPPLGTLPPDHHNVVLVVPPQPQPPQIPKPIPVVQPPKVLPSQKPPMLKPPQTPGQKVPLPTPVVAPPMVPQQTPVLVPPQPPAQKVPTPTPIVEPPKVLPPQQIPVLVPPQPPAQQTTVISHLPPTFTPRPQRVDIPAMAIGGTHATGSGSSSHQLVVHQPPTQTSITSGDHAGSQVYNLEFIEPGIQNHKVEVYRSKDLQERIYQDTIPLDAGGFHLRVIGMRNPSYSH